MNQGMLMLRLLEILAAGDQRTGMTLDQFCKALGTTPTKIRPILIYLELGRNIEARWPGDNFPSANGTPPDAEVPDGQLRKRYYRLTEAGRRRSPT